MPVDFTLPPDVEEVRLKVRKFMDSTVRPEEQRLESNGADRGEYVRTIVGLREKAKGEGLWNPHLPPEWDGMGLGANTKAFVGTLAMDEMGRICEALGGRHATVHGLAGLGDLLTTGYSPHSRNRTLGDKLGAAGDWQLFLRTNTVEGVGACRAICELIQDKDLSVHLQQTVHEMLFEDRPAPEAMRHFLTAFSYG